ncbi:DNA (cytosine-5-)-methyltransferase [Desulfogranum japonicum]|uniref:DNA (cytosine-5-)-methyltransferase n=1 Tax=Desulfogranum japonicum TaxID=231447 RepID=UPI0004183C7A|nr:DNA (cytosine-5-)-methyltransferase [Desulfogranum japonicum]
MSKRTVVDLFAGAGGLSCGLKMAGFQPVLANELEEIYAQTYRDNHPNIDIIVGDVRQVCASGIRKRLKVEKGEIDLLAGGPPCQGFSINAPIRSLDDDRNHLFKEFIRVTQELLPKAVLIENVPGIVSLGKGTVVEQIYRELEELGYKVNHKILFAGHYGVPQMRFRTIFIAIQSFNEKILFPEPKYNSKAVANFTGAKELCLDITPLFAAKLKPQTTVWDAISDLPDIRSGERNDKIEYKSLQPLSEYQKILRNGSEFVFNHSCNNLGKINLERLKHIPQGGSWRDIPFELLPAGLKRARRSDHTKRYGRLDPKGLCSTVLTKCDPHWGSFFHPTQDRVISVREAARIQSFPDRYHFTGSITQQYEQVGNAVPPLMAYEIGKQINILLDQYHGEREENANQHIIRTSMRKKKDLVEIFGYAPDDLSKESRSLWNIGACPFLNKSCIKINHDQSIIYGTCSVTSPYGHIIICPNRLYANNYETLKRVAKDAFGDVQFYLFDEYVKNRTKIDECIVALGKNSGKEVQVGRHLSMDWVLARIKNTKLVEYVGIEIQSIDITGNYRDAWHGYKNLPMTNTPIENIPSSSHGLNWANVHKRLIPQLIRKGVIYSRSSLVKKGLYFILPEIVYKKFEDVVGNDIQTVENASHDTLTVFTYELGKEVPLGNQRDLLKVRSLRFTLEEFSNRFISGPNLPSGDDLDNAIRKVIGTL